MDSDAIRVAFWTCLQLESDILAELDLPPSGISRLEETILFPSDKPMPEAAYYAGQIALRKLLNRVHFSLYNPPRDETKAPVWSVAVVTELEAQLKQWRDLLPPLLQWDDNEPPPSEINAARLRAKYYGARYIIYRPFLHHAIHPSQPTRTLQGPSGNMSRRASAHNSPTGGTVSAGISYSTGRRQSEAMLPPSRANYPHIDDTVLDACRKCIDAAMRSTAAFHGIKHRPIVTNIFGTAHAQFGNLLVLQAASRHPILKELIPQDKLSHLLTKTIYFLRSLSPISPTLKFDATILERVMRSALPTSVSFSSAD